jgi:hypothetical protein
LPKDHPWHVELSAAHRTMEFNANRTSGRLAAL